MASPFFIEADNLQYAYRKAAESRVLAGIDLQIRCGEYILICGASGSGKSTLCRTFNGLIPHFYEGDFAGEIRIAGITTARQSVSRLFPEVGLVFQNPEVQLFNQSVEKEIAFGLESLGLPRPEIKKRIVESAETIGIERLLLRNPHELSGGEQQLVSIAAILALQPQFIVLDEPYANLDPVNVGLVRSVLKKVHRRGMGVIISEHRLLLTVADVNRIAVLSKGKIVMDGPPSEVLCQDLSTYGLELPLAIRIGHRLRLSGISLAQAPEAICASQDFSLDLLPSGPEPLAGDAPVILDVDRISFSANGATVLNNISFNLHRGECLAVVGANGAGKTALIKHLNGLNRPTKGQVCVMGKSTRKFKVSEMARFVGVAFQNPNSQFFKLTVWDEIVVGARTLGCYDESWIRELVQLFRLESLLDRAPYRLSEGEKKRVAFAAALAARPKVLALDEPTAGQDMFFREALGALLAKLRSRGQAILLVTQDLAFAERHAQRWLLMAKGEVVAQGAPRQVMADENAMRQAMLEPTESFQLYALHTGMGRKVKA